MSAFQKFFGCDTLVGPGSATTPVSSLEGKHVLIYFSAHWCPPCREFTPKLAQWYTEFKTKREDVELVYVSSDNDQKQFDEYFAEMPWLALPFENRSQNQAITQAVDLPGVPTLMVFDPQAQLITKKGREGVTQDPSGANFPWKPRTVAEIATDLEITDKDGTVVPYPDLAAKYPQLAIYFASQRSLSCQAFTPKLAAMYQTMKSQGVETEIIFVSWDQNQESYTECRAEMPWPAFSFQMGRELDDTFGVESVPALVTFDTKTGKVISNFCVDEVAEGKSFPWLPTPVPLCSKLNFSRKNCKAVESKRCCILFAKNGSSSVDTDAFAAAAAAYDVSPDRRECTFFTATEPEQHLLFGNISQFLNFPKKDSMVVCFGGGSDNKAHAVFDVDMSKVVENVKTFFASQA